MASKGKLVKSESTSSDVAHPADRPNKNFLLYSKHLKYIGFLIILIMAIIIITTVVILSNKSEKTSETHGIHPEIDDNVTIGPIGPGSLITREKWGGREPLYSAQPLQHPTPLIIIAHTATPVCRSFVKCAARVASIQAFHVSEKNYTDIGYNFLIGGDSNIYVGRGWDVTNFHAKNSIAISFIGNYVFDKLTTEMIESAKKLIAEGVETGKLAKDYKLICHNQIYNTASPGKNVINEVKTWPHYDPNNYYKSKN